MNEPTTTPELNANGKPVKKVKYLTNKSLLEQIRISKDQGKMTEDLGKMILLLTDKYSKHPDYFNIYSYKDDMRSAAVLTLCNSWYKFDETKSQNPFAFFTQISRHAFYQYLNSEKKSRIAYQCLSIELGIDQHMADDFNERAAAEGAVNEAMFVNAHADHVDDTNE